MNGTQESCAKRSDFSIARILANDQFIEKSQYAKSILNFNFTNVSQISFSSTDDSVNNPKTEKSCEFTSLFHSTDYIYNQTKTDSTVDKNLSHPNKIRICSSVCSTAEEKKEEKNELTWLKYTRYKPPKLPRKPIMGKSAKRRPGLLPRIPFSTFQLQILEEKYRQNPYLSRKEVLDTSALLCLPQSRVKIWFQNRRAREKRESQQVK